MKTLIPLSMLAATLLAGCAVMTAPIAPHAEGTVILQPKLGQGSFHAQTVITPYGQADIDHLVVKAFTVANDVEQAITDSSGNPVQRSIASAELGDPVVFGNLHHDTTYRFRAYAYADAGAGQLISTTDAGSYVDVAVVRDDRPDMANLPVKLIDKPFSGETTSGFDVTDGDVIHTGTEGVSLGS